MLRLTLLLAGLAVAADPPAVVSPPATDPAPDLTAPGPADAKYPLPQDRLKAADKLKRRVEWVRKQWLDEFDAAADKMGVGYAKAREAVALAADAEARAGRRNAARQDARNKALKAAAKAGSQELLFLVQHRRGLPAAGSDNALGLTVGQTPFAGRSAYVRAAVHQAVAEEAATDNRPDVRDEHVGLYLKALADLCRDPHPAAAEAADAHVVEAIDDDLLGPAAGDRFARLRPALAAENVPERCRQLAAGVAWLRAAWAVRGPGSAEFVGKEVLARYKDYLAKAETHLTAAADADKTQPQAAVELIAVCTSRGHPRDAMETWFRRAMTADPDNAAACRAKLDYLVKSKAAAAEVLAFGRQCARAGSPETWVPDTLYLAHQAVRAQAKAEDRTKYWVGKGVWADLRAVYEPAVAAQPLDRQTRTRYAQICLRCGHPQAADGHLKAIADRVWVAEFRDPEEAAGLRRAIDRGLTRKRADDDD
jgi:hypothetical protein